MNSLFGIDHVGEDPASCLTSSSDRSRVRALFHVEQKTFEVRGFEHHPECIRGGSPQKQVDQLGANRLPANADTRRRMSADCSSRSTRSAVRPSHPHGPPERSGCVAAHPHVDVVAFGQHAPRGVMVTYNLGKLVQRRKVAQQFGAFECMYVGTIPFQLGNQVTVLTR